MTSPLPSPLTVSRAAHAAIDRGQLQPIAAPDLEPAIENAIRRKNRPLDPRIKSVVAQIDKAHIIKPRPPGLVWLNNSIVQYHGANLMAYRAESYPYWRKSQIGICKCDAQWRPLAKSGRFIDVPGRLGRVQAEDPRLLVHHGQLLMPYTDNRRQLLAYFSSDLEPVVVQIFRDVKGLKLGGQEKNWSFFSHWSGLYAISVVTPHTVVSFNGYEAKLLDKHEWPLVWPFGVPRGGACPVLHDGLYWHWFHSSHNMDFGPDDCRWQNSRRYHTGVYAFDCKPPFRPVAYAKSPVISGVDAEAASLPGVNRPSEHAVVFCCGAVRAPEGWWLSHGENDMRCRIDFVPDDVVLEKLKWL